MGDIQINLKEMLGTEKKCTHRKILVVDDEEFNVETLHIMLAKCLKQIGYKEEADGIIDTFMDGN